MVGPDDRYAKRFHSMGVQAGIAFPPGATFGQHRIAIGDHALVGPRVALSVGLLGESLPPGDPIISIGARVRIGRDSSIAGRVGITIEDDVITGPGVFITDHNHRYDDPDTPIGQQWVDEAEVRVGAGSWIGTGAVILPGTDIGRNVTVAAASVVRGRVPDRCVVAGAPAKVVKEYHEGQGWRTPS